MLGHKTNFNKIKKIAIILAPFQPKWNEIRNWLQEKKLENISRLNNMLLNNQWVNEEIKEEIKKISWDKWKRKHNFPKSMGCSKSSSKREVHNYIGLPQETRKISNKTSNFTPKGTRKRTNKVQS